MNLLSSLFEYGCHGCLTKRVMRTFKSDFCSYAPPQQLSIHYNEKFFKYPSHCFYQASYVSNVLFGKPSYVSFSYLVAESKLAACLLYPELKKKNLRKIKSQNTDFEKVVPVLTNLIKALFAPIKYLNFDDVRRTYIRKRQRNLKILYRMCSLWQCVLKERERNVCMSTKERDKE